MVSDRRLKYCRLVVVTILVRIARISGKLVYFPTCHDSIIWLCF